MCRSGFISQSGTSHALKAFPLASPGEEPLSAQNLSLYHKLICTRYGEPLPSSPWHASCIPSPQPDSPLPSKSTRNSLFLESFLVFFPDSFLVFPQNALLRSGSG